MQSQAYYSWMDAALMWDLEAESDERRGDTERAAMCRGEAARCRRAAQDWK